jgi:two-component system, cell cycle sensor histidine kinase and response regulator CckA
METVGRMVSGVAHDFNNLLTGIVLCSDLLLAGLEKSSRLRRYAEEIRTASAQSAGMIQHLLAVARQQRLEPTLLSFNQVIASMRDLLTRLIGENVELLTELAEDLRPVRIDPAEAEEVILNLVLNARDAMPGGGRVMLSTRNRSAGIGEHSPASLFHPALMELVVRDTGTGMDAETRARVFEPFFTTKRSGKGTGLGLATVYRVVKRAGGTIEIESEPGKGTRIIIRLPAAESNQQTHKPEGRKPL